jgi:hypothetical protein
MTAQLLFQSNGPAETSGPFYYVTPASQWVRGAALTTLGKDNSMKKIILAGISALMVMAGMAAAMDTYLVTDDATFTL